MHGRAVAVNFVTALGDDTWSDEMVASWKAERIGIDLVMRVPGRTPGFYIIRPTTRVNGTFPIGGIARPRVICLHCRRWQRSPTPWSVTA
jgi:sugar/nucleoside kinase (ribokinase family)